MELKYDFAPKYPAAICKIELNWGDWLKGAAIASCEVSVLAGDVVVDSPVASYADGELQIIWVSGGSPGRFSLLAAAVADDGRRDPVVINSQIKQPR